jgi:hypothetical protein
MNGVLNGGVRGASWVPPERRPSAKCSAADTNKSSKNDRTQRAASGHFCLMRCNAYSDDEISSKPLFVSINQ